MTQGALLRLFPPTGFDVTRHHGRAKPDNGGRWRSCSGRTWPVGFPELFAHRSLSRAAAEKLREIEARNTLLLSGAEAALTYAAAADLIDALDEAVVDEIESWQSVFGAKHLALPA